MNIVIVGGTSGFGLALAKAFADRGDKVLIGGRSKPEDHSLFEHSISHVHCELRESKAIAAFCHDVHQRFETVDCLINAAASPKGVGTIAEAGDEEWQEIFQVNLFGAVSITRNLLQTLRASRGLILTICSLAAHRPLPAMSTYCASKAALWSFTRSLADEEWIHGVRANGIGIIADTKLFQHHTRELQQLGLLPEGAPTFPVPRVEESTALPLFLASKQGRHVTGQYFECHSSAIKTW